MTLSDVVERLAQVRFFSGVPQAELERLVKGSPQPLFQKGTLVLHQGEHSNSMFVLLRGRVLLQVKGGFAQGAADGAPGDDVYIPVRFVDASGGADAGQPWDPGVTWFGEGAVLGRTQQPYTVEAVDDVLALELRRDEIERLDHRYFGVLDKLRELSDRSLIEAFLLGHRAFAAMQRRDMRLLCDHSKLLRMERGREVFTHGSTVRSVYIVKSGVGKLVRPAKSDAGKPTVLGYFSSGDVIGAFDVRRRPGALLAMELLELIEVPKNRFKAVGDRLAEVWPGWWDQFRKVETKEEDSVVSAVVGGHTVATFVDDLFMDSGHQARSLMTIDLDTCIRCGNCVRACESRHGYPKMVRRGNKMTRKAENVDVLGLASRHENVLLPTSCRHCESPECMIGCPTGAIHRKPTGEVAIHDTCIGCSNCALRCPWDNITMVILDQKKERPDYNLMVDRIASKCDLCFGYSEANCVYNCPTQAIMRVNPHTYFPEVGAQLRDLGRGIAEGQRTSATRSARRAWPVLLAVTLVAIVGLLAIRTLRPVYSPTSWPGVLLGVIALLLFLGATALAVRRRMAGRGRRAPSAPGREPAPAVKGAIAQLGPYHLWAKAHLVLGVVAAVAVGLHSNGQASTLLTASLLAMTGLQVATGVFGVFFSWWQPRVITRLEGLDSQLEEDIRDEKSRLDSSLALAVDEVAEAERATVRRALAKGRGALGPLLSPRAAETTRAQVTGDLAALGAEGGARAKAFGDMAARQREIAAVLMLYGTRRAWLAMHIATTAALMTATFVHVITSLTHLGGVP